MIFPDITEITSIDVRFFNANGQWIYLPKRIEIFSSKNGKTYESLKSLDNVKARGKVANLKINFKDLKTKYLKVVATNYGKIPQGKQGEGNRAWLFVDEISIN